MTAKDLARRCARGDAEAWDEFIKQYGPVIFGSARFTLQRVLGRAVDADVENVYQLVLLSLLKNNGRKLLSYEGRSDLAAWLRVVTSRHALNYLRSE